MSVPRWFIARDKERVGPFAAADLKQLAVCGLLKPSEHVWMEGAAKWVEAALVPGLFPPPGQKRYWLTLAGATRGPYALEQIRGALTMRQVTLETPARAEDGQEWLRLGQCPEFQNFVASTLSPSRAQLLMGTLDLEEATLHLAGKSGDALAKLICTLMDLKRNYGHNVALVEHLDTTIQVLQRKREQEQLAAAEPKG